MTKILKAESKGKSGVFAGTYVSAEESCFLSLVCAADGITKTDVIRTMFAEWYETNHSEETVKLKVHAVAKKAFSVFMENRTRPHAGKKSRNFDLFCTNLTEELGKKGIAETAITAIISRINFLYKKHEEKNKG